MLKVIRMDVVKAKSEKGFMLEGSDSWLTCDKSFVNSELFKSLNKGDKISAITFNKDRYVTSFVLFSVHAVQKFKEEDKLPKTHKSNDINSLKTSSASDFKSREILKGQCLNLAFKNVDTSDSHAREFGIRIAQKLLDELEAADYYNW